MLVFRNMFYNTTNSVNSFGKFMTFKKNEFMKLQKKKKKLIQRY